MAKIKKTTFRNPSGKLDMSFSEGVEIIEDENFELDLHVGDMLHTIKDRVPMYEVTLYAVDTIEVRYTDGTTIRYERLEEETN